MASVQDIVLLRTAVNQWATTLALPPLPMAQGIDSDLRARTREIAAMIYQAAPTMSGVNRVAVAAALGQGLAPGADGIDLYARTIAQSFIAAAKPAGTILDHPAGPREQMGSVSLPVLGAAAVGGYLLLRRKKR